MICSSCDKYRLLLIFEEYIVSITPSAYEVSESIERIYEACVEIANKDFECDKCRRKVITGESYIEDDEKFSEMVFQYFAQLAMDNIDSCEQCGAGEDIQELLPSIKSGFDKDDDYMSIFESINTSSTIEDIMNIVFEGRVDLWNSYYEEIVEYVKCPKCKNGSGSNYDDKCDYGKFDLDTEVYTQKDIVQFNHDFYGDELKEAKIELSELAQKFSFKELVELKNEYLRNKTFASKNVLFNRLEELIKSFFMQNKYYILSENRLIFRTRTSSSNLKKEELWEPPYAVSSHGRYNDIGVSILYCANNREAVKREIPLPCGHDYNIAKFIIHKPMLLFPINHVFGGEFAGLIDEVVPAEQQNLQYKQQYILSNIVSAICFQVGYDGIVYRSTKDNCSIDYALFCNYKKGEDIEILDVDASA
jgi:hypothetical protein